MTTSRMMKKTADDRRQTTDPCARLQGGDRAYAVWTRSHSSQPWRFHTAYTTAGKARKISEGLSYMNDTRVTSEGYKHTKTRGTR